MQYSQSIWYRPNLTPVTLLLLPLSWLFSLVVYMRKWLYAKGVLKSHRFAVPVIVVGNITVGGTGKTPFVGQLVKHLQESGFTPGVVSRGVGGKRNLNPVLIGNETPVEQVGDEAVMLAKKLECPVVVCTDRVSAVQHLLRSEPSCDVVISDDGLQHYRMSRDIEIAIIDGMRLFGNRHLLPAGPLREPINRLNTVDYKVVNSGQYHDAYTMHLQPKNWVNVKDRSIKIDLNKFKGITIHAVAGIGNPSRFFNTLVNMGYDVITHQFPDHFNYSRSDVMFNDKLPVLMTEKDAVKCELFAGDQYWYLDSAVDIQEDLLNNITMRLQGNKHAI